MKKGISKFLSIMYGVTVLSGMLSMNSASAVYWSEEEASTIFPQVCNCNYDLSNKTSVEWFIGTVTFKLNNFLKTHLGKNLYDFRTEIIENITNYEINETIRDRRLRFIQPLEYILKRIADNSKESPEFVHKWLYNFGEVISYMSVVVDDLENGFGVYVPTSEELIISAIEREDFGSMDESTLEQILHI